MPWRSCPSARQVPLQRPSEAPTNLCLSETTGQQPDGVQPWLSVPPAPALAPTWKRLASSAEMPTGMGVSSSLSVSMESTERRRAASGPRLGIAKRTSEGRCRGRAGAPGFGRFSPHAVGVGLAAGLAAMLFPRPMACQPAGPVSTQAAAKTTHRARHHGRCSRRGGRHRHCRHCGAAARRGPVGAAAPKLFVLAAILEAVLGVAGAADGALGLNSGGGGGAARPALIQYKCDEGGCKGWGTRQVRAGGMAKLQAGRLRADEAGHISDRVHSSAQRFPACYPSHLRRWPGRRRRPRRPTPTQRCRCRPRWLRRWQAGAAARRQAQRAAEPTPA